MMPEIAPLEAGEPRRLGPFRVVGRIGEGGQGVVYLGVDAAGERAAIKLLHVKFSGDAIARSRFAREARAAQRVASFCTAGVVDADLEGDTPYIASEYIEGRSLREIVETDGPLKGAPLQRLAIGTATALTAIHHASIVHRDFKPDNVLIAADGPRVVDFGIARILDSTGTITSRAIGTPAYMAPEQISGAEVGPHTDVFAWGATIAFAATGETTFAGGSIAVVLNRILNHEVDLGTLPEPLRGVVGSALAKSPATRPSADQLLLRLLGHPETVNASSAILTQGAQVAVPEPSRDESRSRERDRDRGPADGGDQGLDSDATSPMRTPKPRTGGLPGVSSVPGASGAPGVSGVSGAPGDQRPLPSTGFRAQRPAHDRRPHPEQGDQGGQGFQQGPAGRTGTGQGERRAPAAHGGPSHTPAPASAPVEHPSFPDHRFPDQRPSESRPQDRRPQDRFFQEHPSQEHLSQDRLPPDDRPPARHGHPPSPDHWDHPSSPGHGGTGYVEPGGAGGPGGFGGEVPPPSWQASTTLVGAPETPGRARRGRWIAAAVAVLLLVAGGAAVIRWWPWAAPEGEPEKPVPTAFTSVVDKAAGTGRLVIGVRDSLPGIALNNQGRWSGFEVDLALELAKAMGVPESGVTFRSTARPERPKLLAQGDVDMVLATYSINETDDVTFAGPYYLAHVDVLVKDGSPIVDLKGLEGRRMCQPASSAAVAVLQGEVQQLTLVPAQTYTECVNMLQAGQVDAIPGDDLLLAGFADRESIRYKLLGLKLTDERYAVALKRGDARTCEAVRGAIADLHRSGTIRRLLDKHFSRVEFPGRENGAPAMAPCA
ncbi:transporter substrate-binding domain-containing protein [Streptosporangium sp. NPDC048865]|uniref:bifunctional serine/threonine-protein kinase/glutamate ABC transporter substrate-binding protein n=1 Tax=Streptosporangium sp. NPDC048865 TaxID=3155766 RepID=UPI00342AF414